MEEEVEEVCTLPTPYRVLSPLEAPGQEVQYHLAPLTTCQEVSPAPVQASTLASCPASLLLPSSRPSHNSQGGRGARHLYPHLSTPG